MTALILFSYWNVKIKLSHALLSEHYRELSGLPWSLMASAREIFLFMESNLFPFALSGTRISQPREAGWKEERQTGGPTFIVLPFRFDIIWCTKRTQKHNIAHNMQKWARISLSVPSYAIVCLCYTKICQIMLSYVFVGEITLTALKISWTWTYRNLRNVAGDGALKLRRESWKDAPNYPRRIFSTG